MSNNKQITRHPSVLKDNPSRLLRLYHPTTPTRISSHQLARIKLDPFFSSKFCLFIKLQRPVGFLTDIKRQMMIISLRLSMRFVIKNRLSRVGRRRVGYFFIDGKQTGCTSGYVGGVAQAFHSLNKNLPVNQARRKWFGNWEEE